MIREATVVALVLSLACPCGCLGRGRGGSSGDDDDPISDGDADGDLDGDGDTTIDEDGDGPRFLDFGANTGTMTPSVELVFSAVLTDPDGIDDLIGGTLVDPAGGTYGAFQTAAAEGAYTLTLRWAEIDAVRPLDFSVDGSERVFRAVFFDVAGHEVSDEISVRLDCDGDDEGSCDGTCVSLSSNDDCGECGNSCDDLYDVPEVLTGYGCDPSRRCLVLIQSMTRDDCDTVCSASALVCTTDNPDGDAGVSRYGQQSDGNTALYDAVALATCETTPAATLNTWDLVWVECFCRQP